MTTLRDKLRSILVLKGIPPKLDFGLFPSTPQEAFEIWLDQAIEAGVPEPHALTLSTTDDQGRPDARVLILKDIDERGWHFAIKGDSPKGQQIQANKNVALTFYWPAFRRQVRVRGRAVALSDDECAQDFDARPLMAKATAMASRQSQAGLNHEELSERILDARQAVEAGNGLPAWVVYAVAPESVEFWQGSDDRLHQRLRFVLDGLGGWSKEFLWP